MDRSLCIHGHFYQPPREDPWLDRILPEGSAAPSRHWNERICGESYAPMAFARRLDGQGKIVDIVNCYEWMSFNAGPTLLTWMARSAPETYARMLEADKASAARLGFGNALAQVYHHVIMPLASSLDKEVEAAWAVADFTARFGRAPEGMWLAETAVDTASLEALAACGIRFTILAPSQAEAVSVDGVHWQPLDAGRFSLNEPYAVNLPSGRPMAVFFYDGPLSQAVAFERLLADGENFFRRLSAAARPGILALATDGETYGHHFKFGEMALAYVLEQARTGRDGLKITNFAAHLAANPPRRFVRVRERSAWSCAHGVERWRSNCGCTDGGHPSWNQRWRAPLRDSLNLLKECLDAHFFAQAAPLMPDPKAALVAYGEVMAGMVTQEAFAAARFKPGLAAGDTGRAWKLLSMEQWGLAMFASCAWFFDEISRLEPVNGLTFALRAMELGRATGMVDPEPEFAAILGKAASNIPEVGSGLDVWESMVKPRRETPKTLLTQALMQLAAEERLPAPGEDAVASWPGVAVTVTLGEAKNGERAGEASVLWNLETAPERFGLAYRPSPGLDLYDGCATIIPERPDAYEEGVCFREASLPVNKRQSLADAWAVHHEAAAWARTLAESTTGVRLVTELQEAQTTLNLAPLWVHLWPGLAWQYLFGLNLPEKRAALLDLFLKATGQGNPAASLLAERLGAEMTRRIAEEADPDVTGLIRAVNRARGLGINPDWWQAQNTLWRLRPWQGRMAELARALGFAG